MSKFISNVCTINDALVGKWEFTATRKSTKIKLQRDELNDKCKTNPLTGIIIN